MTVRTHRKYLREELAKADYSQAYFTREGQIEALRTAAFKEGTGLDLNKIVFCPFCLADDKVQRFLVSTKKGISTGRAQCPTCGQGMMLRNIVKDWTPETYAKWVYEYSGSGFWQKINFELWKDRLYARGWSQAFWDVYRQLKSDSPREENYEDRMNRQGEEAAQQWQREGEAQVDA